MSREKRLNVRFAAVGGEVVKAELRGIGDIGQAAMQKVATSTGPAEAGLDNFGNSAAKARQMLEMMGVKSLQTAANLRTTAQAATAMQAQINRATGVSPLGGSAADIIRQGQALDDLRAKYNPVFSVIRQYRNEVSEMRAAHIEGAISADELAAAISRSRQAALGSIAVYKNQSQAIAQMSRSARGGTLRMQQMFFQMNDIGVSLAGGMNPFLVLAQQGTQIAQIYGFGNGGVTGIFRDLGKMIGGVVGRFPLITAAVIGIGGALAGLTSEINQVSDVTVTFGDTALAVWQVVSEGIWSWIKPAVDAIAPWFAAAWDLVVAGVKNVGNFIINSFAFVAAGIGIAIDTVPAMFASAFKAALAEVQWAVGRMAHSVYDMLSSVAKGMNSVFGTSLSGPGGMQAFGTEMLKRGTANSAASRALAARGDLFGRLGDARADIFGRDPMGDLFDTISGRAQANARNRLAGEEDGKGAGGGAGKAAKEQKSAVDGLIESLTRELSVLQETDPIKKKMLEYSKQLTGATDGERQQVLALVTSLDKAKHGWDAVGRALQEYAQESMRLGDDLGKGLVNTFGRVEDAVAQFVSKGKADFKDLVISMIADLSKLATQRFITGPLSGWLGNLIGGFGGDALTSALGTAGLPAALPSFDGGGWTGDGPRSGGLDKKGGFLAMLHPEEFVHDTRKSGRAVGGGVVRIVIEESASFASTVRSEADGVAVDRVRQGLDAFRRQVLPGEVNRTIARPRDVG